MHKSVIVKSSIPSGLEFGGLMTDLVQAMGASELFEDSLFSNCEVKTRLPKGLVSGSYPPANLMVDSDKNLIIQIAAAGFAEKDITVESENDNIIATFKAPESQYKTLEEQLDENDDEEETDEDSENTKEPYCVKYLQRGIKIRDSQLKFYVDPKMFDKSNVTVNFVDGMLTIVVGKNPDLDVKKSFKINNK